MFETFLERVTTFFLVLRFSVTTLLQYEEALDIVEQSATPLSEELSERLAAPSGTAGRDALLRRLADVLGGRGLYHQAAKRLAHAGDKVWRATNSAETNSYRIDAFHFRTI